MYTPTDIKLNYGRNIIFINISTHFKAKPNLHFLESRDLVRVIRK